MRTIGKMYVPLIYKLIKYFSKKALVFQMRRLISKGLNKIQWLRNSSPFTLKKYNNQRTHNYTSLTHWFNVYILLPPCFSRWWRSRFCLYAKCCLFVFCFNVSLESTLVWKERITIIAFKLFPLIMLGQLVISEIFLMDIRLGTFVAGIRFFL